MDVELCGLRDRIPGTGEPEGPPHSPRPKEFAALSVDVKKPPDIKYGGGCVRLVFRALKPEQAIFSLAGVG